MDQAHRSAHTSTAATSASAPFLDTGLPLFSGLPYKVRDLSAATVTFGRKELDLALWEMPGLSALRTEYATHLGRAWFIQGSTLERTRYGSAPT